MQILIAVFAILIVLISILWILVPTIYGLPPVSTKHERIRQALKLANLQAGETLYDLGSGHGHVLIIAAKEFEAQAVGIEIGPVQCVVAWINAVQNGVRSQVRIEARNFYHADLTKADVVFAYLTSSQANRLQEKFQKELKKGTRVVTISFDFPNWKPVCIDRENLIFLYKK